MAMEQLQALAGSQGLQRKKSQENLDQFLSSSWHFGVAQLVPFCFFRCRFTLGPSVSEVGVDKLHGIISLLQGLAGSRAADPAAEKTAPAATGSQPAVPATQAPAPAASASSPKAAPAVLTAAAGAAAVGKLAEAFNTSAPPAGPVDLTDGAELSDAETLALDKLLEDELDAQEVAETQPDQQEAEPEGTTPGWANPAPASPLPPAKADPPAPPTPKLSEPPALPSLAAQAPTTVTHKKEHARLAPCLVAL